MREVTDRNTMHLSFLYAGYIGELPISALNDAVAVDDRNSYGSMRKNVL